MNDEPLEAVAYTRYEIDCPACADTFCVEHDPAGETLPCEVCGALIRVTETR